MATRPVLVHPLPGIGEVRPGDRLDLLLEAALREQALRIEPDDVLVVTSKIVSKSEGCIADLEEASPGAEALRLAAITGKDPRLVELVLRQSTAVVRAAPNVLITRHHLGLVMANAGIDQSNRGPGSGSHVLLLPVDPDASAERLRVALSGLRGSGSSGSGPAIVISDSFGRPWRYGVVNVAIGASGLPALVDRRNEPDRDGRHLEVTQVALADMIAAAAGLVCGEGAESVPAALVRGYPLPAGRLPAASLVRPPEQDLFR